MVDITLTGPQFDFVVSESKFPAMVAGYGAGKTHAAIYRALKYKIEYPELPVAYYLPTYDLIKLIALPRITEALDAGNVQYQYNDNDKVIKLNGCGKIILRTMDRPERIVGYEVADSIIDELDTLNVDKAADVWRKVVARNRAKKPDGKPNTIGVATTPEGFRFVYEHWKRKPMQGSEIIKASTYSNRKNIPDDYIDTLKATYPDQMLEAYLNGEFVNLTQGAVYREFDRDLNCCSTTIEPGETLHIGMDFNVGQMAAVVHVLRDGQPHAVSEYTELLDTPTMIKHIERDYRECDKPHSIMVYPDASGQSKRSVNASESDLALLRSAKFTVLANKRNPYVKDRVASFNAMIHKADDRKYRVNLDKCPHLVECLEKQAYDKNGEPDKTSGLDHLVDAAGYFISYRYPVTRGKARVTKITGF